MRGRPPDERRRERQARAGPLLDAFRHWLDATGPGLSRRSDLAVAVRYAGDGRLEIDDDRAERSLRSVAELLPWNYRRA